MKIYLSDELEFSLAADEKVTCWIVSNGSKEEVEDILSKLKTKMFFGADVIVISGINRYELHDIIDDIFYENGIYNIITAVGEEIDLLESAILALTIRPDSERSYIIIEDRDDQGFQKLMKAILEKAISDSKY